jgi:hypothetical protein
MKPGILGKIAFALGVVAAGGALAALTGCHARPASSAGIGAANLAQLSKSLAAAPPGLDNDLTAAEKSTTIRFQDADCKHLNQADVERYVDPRVVGSARRTALRYMLSEPACHRENVEGIDRTVPYSNTWEGLVEVSKEYNGWHRQPDGTYKDSSGDTITPTNPRG